MKRRGKIYLGILFSFFMMLLMPVSALAAGEDGEVFIDEESQAQTDETEAPVPEYYSDPVSEIIVSPDKLTLNVKGQTAQLTVTIEPEDATDKEVIWGSSNDAVATVKDGTVTAEGNGTATITVTSADNAEVSDTCKITVSLYGDGFHQDPDSDDWYYYKNGSVDTSKTDVMQGTVNGKSGWWNVVKGKVTREETVAQNSNGWWYINSDGMVDFSYKGFAQNENGWWYLENGKVGFNTDSVIQDTNNKIDDTAGWWYVVGSKVQKDFTGLADYSNANGWWYINDGKVTFNVETVAQNKNGWWYVKDSKVDFSYNGFAENENGCWYIEDGTVTFNKNSVIQDTNNKIDDTAGWWYVVGSKVQKGFTGLADYSNANGWWYINDGKVTFNVETVAQNKNGWWYVKDSKVDFSYNGFAENENGCWYIEDGKVTFNKNSVIQDTNKKIDDTAGWWYVVGSKVQIGFTGLADYSNANGWWYINDGKVTFDVNTIAENKNGWWYVRDSKVDFSYNGFAENSNGWWYIESGQVTFNKNSVIQGTVDGTNAWWYVVGSKVQTGFTGLGDYGNSNGWWYIKNGQVDFTHNGVDQNKNGWWYVLSGKVRFDYTGVCNYANSNGWWYVKNGKVDFSYTGAGANRHGVWYVKNGKVDFSFTGTFKSGGVTYKAKDGKVYSSSSGSEGYSLTSSQLSRTKTNKGIWISDHTFTQDEYYSLVKKFMSSDPYATTKGYSMTGSNFVFDKNPGTRWDCSSMTDYFLSRYVCYYASKYYDAMQSNPSASASKLQQTALNSIPPSSTSSFYKEITSNSLRYYLPETSTYNGYKGAVASAETNTLTQMQYWGNPVYTADTYKQISYTNPGNLQVGDLLFFGSAPGTNGQTYGSVTHVAIYLGEYFGKGNGYYMLENVGYTPRKVFEYDGTGTVKGVQISYFETEIGSESHVLWHAARVINVTN